MLYAAIMFSLPFAIGLSCLALDLPVSGNEVGNGLAFPATAYALIGKSGCVQVFLPKGFAPLFPDCANLGTLGHYNPSSLKAQTLWLCIAKEGRQIAQLKPEIVPVDQTIISDTLK